MRTKLLLSKLTNAFLKDTIELSIQACEAYRNSGGSFCEYRKLIRLRDEVTKKMLNDLQNQVNGG